MYASRVVYELARSFWLSLYYAVPQYYIVYRIPFVAVISLLFVAQTTIPQASYLSDPQYANCKFGRYGPTLLRMSAFDQELLPD